MAQVHWNDEWKRTQEHQVLVMVLPLVREAPKLLWNLVLSSAKVWVLRQLVIPKG